MDFSEVSNEDDRLVLVTLLLDIVTNLIADRSDVRHQFLPAEYIDEMFLRSSSSLRFLQSMGFRRQANNSFLFDPNTSIEQLTNVLRRLEDLRDRRTTVKIPSSLAKIIPFHSTLAQVQSYEEKQLLQHIRQEILPASVVREDKDRQLFELLKWFKEEFFTWFDQSECQRCRVPMTFSQFVSPTREEREEGDAQRVELYRCSRCSSEDRFPRFNKISMLLKTRQGRCGEAANLFTCLCRALDMESRYIYDTTDHVWTEVYSPSLGRWIHCDACENTCDSPLMYEQGWKKQLSFCVAFARDHLEDVTWRYVTNLPQTIERRKINERQFQRVIQKLNQSMQRSLQPQRRTEVVKRRLTDLVEMLMEKRPTKESELHGRQSGSAAWRLARGEITPAFSYLIETVDCERGKFTVEYNSVSDRYSLNGQDEDENVRWSSRLHSYSNVQRKMERDWKKVYLSRETLHSPGRLSWHFQIHPSCRSSHRISNVTLQCPTHRFDEHGEMQCFVKFSDGTSREILVDPSTQRFTSQFDEEKNLEEIFVEVLINSSNDSNDLNAWQKTQLCRQSTPADDRSHLLFIELRLSSAVGFIN